jgi:ABC-2 type transport system ATP-binding protein
MNFLKPDSGTARVFGLAVEGASGIEIRRRIGFVTEEKELYPYMNVEHIIRFTRGFFPHWRADLEKRYLKSFDLPPKKSIPDLSKGMLLLAICRGADLLILDEPTEGLDPAATEEILRELVALSADGGITIFFSSHQLAEVEQIADHISIIDRGRAIITDSLDDLKVKYQRVRVVLEREMSVQVKWVDGVERVHQEGRMISLLASRNIDSILEQARCLQCSSVEQFPVTLKEIFLESVRSE